MARKVISLEQLLKIERQSNGVELDHLVAEYLYSRRMNISVSHLGIMQSL